MLFGRKLPKVALSGNSKGILTILEKDDFGVENTMNHTKVLSRTAAHEKFPNYAVRIFQLEAMVPLCFS